MKLLGCKEFSRLSERDQRIYNAKLEIEIASNTDDEEAFYFWNIKLLNILSEGEKPAR